MFSNILSTLEHPEHPLLGPTLWGLKTWGMWQPTQGKISTMYNIMHLLAILFVVSQYVELWFLRSNLELALRNLSITMLSTVCVIKAGTFVLWKKEWKSIIDYISTTELEQLEKKHTVNKSIIKEYTEYSRKVTFLYSCLTGATVFTVVLAPFVIYLTSTEDRELMKNGTIPYPEIMSSWTPFDNTNGLGYWILFIEQSLICVYGGGIVANYDSNAVVIMTFFTGQFKILKNECVRLFGDGTEIITYYEVTDRIRLCHNHHVNLVRYSRIFNSLLSPVMFLYVIICSLMICASAIQLTGEGTTSMQQIWIAEYLAALITQLFLYCWHSNEVLFMSLQLSEGVYSSAWWSQGVRARRSVMLLGGQLGKTFQFTAGYFTKLTVATFITILKGSYSYFTLLSKKDV